MKKWVLHKVNLKNIEHVQNFNFSVTRYKFTFIFTWDYVKNLLFVPLLSGNLGEIEWHHEQPF